MGQVLLLLGHHHHPHHHHVWLSYSDIYEHGSSDRDHQPATGASGSSLSCPEGPAHLECCLQTSHRRSGTHHAHYSSC